VIGVLGQLAVAHTGVVLLLVPADPLRPRRADGHFAAEAAAARDAGHDVVLVDHEALAEPGGAGRAVARVRDGGGRAVYRGWMLASDRYAAFAEALTARGVTLRTSAGQYRRAHKLPGWYPVLAPVTPAAVWAAGEGEEEFRAACERLGPGPAVLRDYVKSMKHYWHEAACIPVLPAAPPRGRSRPGSVSCAGTSSPAASCCAASRRLEMRDQGGEPRLRHRHLPEPALAPCRRAVITRVRRRGRPFWILLSPDHRIRAGLPS
jgi:hypothetical protein